MRRIQGADIGPANTYKERNPATNDPGTKVADDALNDIQEEIARGIESVGDVVDVTDYESGTGDRDQMFKAVAHYGAGGASRFIEEGTSAADAYVIEQETLGVLPRNAPSALFDDQDINFLTSNPNAGASTVDVSLLLSESVGTTIKSIVDGTGTALIGGEITTEVRAKFDLANDRFVLYKLFSSPNKTVAAAGTDIYTAPIALAPQDGEQFILKFANANTAASTINGKTAVTVTGAVTPAGYIRTDTNTKLFYDKGNDRYVLDREREKDSNANGTFVRLADGSQKCSHIAALVGGTTNAVSGITGMFHSSEQTWTYPAAFISLETYIVKASRPSGDVLFAWESMRAATLSTLITRVLSNDNAGVFSVDLITIAEGTWY